MQRIGDLSKEELLTVTDEQVRRFIEIELAYAGIIPIAPPGDKPTAPSIETTVSAFKVGDLIFLDATEAATVAAMPSMRKSQYDYNGGGWEYQWLGPAEAVGVQGVRFYSETQIAALKKELVEYKQKAAAWDQHNAEYQKFHQKVNDITNGAWKPVLEARRLREEIAEANKVLVKYRELAEGDEQIARNFFKKAYADRQDILDAVMPDEVVAQTA
jgi:hypothetical protein